jgi:branched-subunit amino acid transport protein
VLTLAPLPLSCAIAVLAAGTFGFRLAGPALRSRIRVPARATRLLEVASVVLLVALVATSTLFTEHEFAGVARPAGVLVGGLLAWRRSSFVLVLLAAAATTSVLRLLGVP